MMSKKDAINKKLAVCLYKIVTKIDDQLSEIITGIDKINEKNKNAG